MQNTAINGMKMTTLEADVMNALRAANISQSRVILPPLAKPVYQKVNKTLVELGGEWNSKAQAHLFPDEANKYLAPVLESGQMIFARKQDYFPTPQHIIETMMCWCEINAGMAVLEPSCGEGKIADEIRDYFGVKNINLDLVEFNPKLAATLIRKGYTPENNSRVFCQNFLEYEPDRLYDRVIMNPPFAKMADIDHVRRAFGMLKPNGILVTIMSHGTLWRTESKAVDFRRFIEPYEHITIEFTDHEFRESGTDVKTCLIALINN